MDDTQASEPPDRAAIGLAIGAITLLSAKPIFIKWAYDYGLDATNLMTLRLLMSAPFFIVAGLWALRRHTIHARDLWLAAGLGVLGCYLAGWLDLLGLMFIPAQLERMLLFTYPIFTVALSWLFYRTPVTGAMGRCMLLTYSGLALLFGTDYALHGSGILLGSLYVLAASLIFAAYMVWSKAPIVRMGSVAFTAVVMLSGTLAMVGHAQLEQAGTGPATDWQGLPMEAWLACAALALFSTVIPAFMGSEAVKRLGPEQVSLLGNTGPLITSVLAIGLLGEPFSAQHAAGMALVILGIAALQAPGRRRRQRRAAA